MQLPFLHSKGALPREKSWSARSHVQTSAVLERKKKRQRIVLGILIALVVGICGALVGSTHIPALTIHTVSIEGGEGIRPDVDKLVDAFLARERSRILARANLVLFPEATLERTLLDTFPRLKSAEVRVSYLVNPSLVVRLAEREPAYMWCGDSCFVMDTSGFVFGFVQDYPGMQYPAFKGVFGASTTPIGSVFVPEVLPEAARTYESLSKAGYTVLYARVAGDEVTYHLAEGFEVRSVVSALPELKGTLSLVLASEALRGKRSELEYVDIRFKNRVYYRFKSDTASSTPATLEEVVQ
jgi:cell division septal protein FtsQ